MKIFNEFVIVFCTSCIFLGFLYMLCPDGNMSPSVKYIFCLCFLCSVLSCVTDLKTVDFKDFTSKGETDYLTEQSAAVTAQSVFGTALSSQNINFTKISVDTNKLSDGSIIISKVTVYSDREQEEIIKAIGSDSYEVCVINE